MLNGEQRTVEGCLIADSVESRPVHLPQLLQTFPTLFLVDVEQAGTLQFASKVTMKRRVGHIVGNGDICWSQ